MMKLLNDMYTIKAWGDDGKKACIEFNADHIIYHAHFPGNPITPGVCIIKIISEITELITNKSLNLYMVKNLKFVSPISPIENPCVNICIDKMEEVSEMLKIKGMITDEDKIYTKFSIIYNCL